MKLSSIVKNFRTFNNISMDEFANRAGLSKSYISMIENGKNARDDKPISPTLKSLLKIATAMNIELDDLLKQMDSDESINLTERLYILGDVESCKLSMEELDLIKNFRALNIDGKQEVRNHMDYILSQERFRKDTESQEGSGTA